MTPARIVLVGAHGHGRWHLDNLRRLQSLGRATLIGVCDVKRLSDENLAGFGSVAQSPSLPALLNDVHTNDDVHADVVVIATPIHTHLAMATVAAERGVAVLLEKPPTPTMAEFERLVNIVETAGIACQVGFQSLGSGAVTAAREIIATGAIGQVRGIGVAGAWQRDESYYARAPWAGRRSMDGVPVTDGALTNAFAHALATVFRLDDTDSGPVHDIELELYHANSIESDDTSSLRLRSRRGTLVTVAVTLCAETERLPYLLVHGDRGQIVLRYTTDEVELTTAEGTDVRRYQRVDLLEDLIAHLADPARPLLVPLPSIRAFMEVLDAVQRAPEPRALPADAVRTVGRNGTRRRVVTGIDADVVACAAQLETFSGLGLAWSVPAAESLQPGASS